LGAPSGGRAALLRLHLLREPAQLELPDDLDPDLSRASHARQRAGPLATRPNLDGYITDSIETMAIVRALPALETLD
jgi:hypothetical protein